MKFTKSEEILDYEIIDIDRYEDNRGYFQELYRESRYGDKIVWRQTSFSSSKKNVIRGIHYSKYPKLCTCVRGKLFDVCVDLRPLSKTYLNWVGIWLDESNKKQVYIPANCGHAFYSAEDNTSILYMMGDMYDPNDDLEFNWLDPTIGIKWPEADEYILSEKDRFAPLI